MTFWRSARPTESILKPLLRFTWPPKPIVLHVILEVCKTDGIHPETTPAFHLVTEAHCVACHSGGL
ncbi:hypothetical protein [uncultured Fibrobacter sp.]|uniref:hypothetical protein n=1 Tax=uncultured Fibrobacter sp. TaxID=261512 RepID=UPI0025D7BE47|nr:hypothetical protein [uncultured Fibrobacter sp.]